MSEILFNKKCPYCKKDYQTTSRKQKFCCPECREKFNKRSKAQKKHYNEFKELERIKSRSHSLAVAILEEYARLGIREKKCECCGATDNLQVHHIDQFNFLNNTPENLRWYCSKCHAKEHSRVENDLNSKGILLEEFYNKSMSVFYKNLFRYN